MKTNVISLLLLFLVCGLSAQFPSSTARLTIESSSLYKEYNSVGAISNDRDYAISTQYEHVGGESCWRRLSYFDGDGSLLATSENYSWDHTGVTKIAFDPNNDRVVYALFRERVSPVFGTTESRTYLRRFVRSGSVVNMSSKYDVFQNTNSSSFVIAPNGDLLVGNVQDDGSVVVRPVRYVNGWTSAPALTLSYSGEATLSGGLSQISMDMKGNTFITAHSRAISSQPEQIKLKKALYAPATQTASTLYTYYINDKLLNNAAILGGINQSVGLKPTGEILYVSKPELVSSTWNLNSLSVTGVGATIETGTGKASLAVSENEKSFLARSSASGIVVDLFSESNGLEYTFTPVYQLTTGFSHIAVKECMALGSGKYNNDSQYHQTYGCEGCAELNANLALNPPETRFHETKSGLGIVVNSYCGNIFSIPVFGANSTCYTEYRFEMIQVSHATLAPIGAPIYQNPNLGGFTTGIIPNVVQVDGTNMTYGKLYRIQLIVKEGLNIDISTKYVEEIECGLKSDDPGFRTFIFDSSSAEISTSSVFPNPTLSDQITLNVSEYGKEGARATIYSTSGTIIKAIEVQSNEKVLIDLNTILDGLYIIKIEGMEREETIRFVKN